MGCCPFHNEKTPSFSVSPDKQLYHCFGCGASGNAIGFTMEYDRLDFIAAVEELASQLGMEIPRDATDSGPDLKPIYQILALCSQFYQQQLKADKTGAAVAYLKDRGVSGEIAKLYGIGYAPDGWDNLLKAEGKANQQQQQLVTAGMLIQKDNGGFYDRFRDRIMFPIIDRRGRAIGFGGRVLGKGEPKYLNSPETPVFHKGNEVYGLYQALQANKTLPYLLVVEGYMDVVALAQFGVSCSVATLGTALTIDHIRLLFRNTGKIVFCFDGDKAGKSAAWRSLETCLSEIKDGRQARFLFLPDGEDPDTLIRKEGSTHFQHRIDNSVPLSEYMLSHLSEQCDLSNIDGKAQLASLAQPLLKRVADPVFRDLLQQQMQLAVGTSQNLSGENNPQQFSQRAATSNKTVSSRPRPVTPMRKTIGLLVQHPALGQKLENWQQLIGSPEAGSDLLFKLLEILQQQPHLTTASLIEHWRDDPSYQHLMTLANWNHEIPQEIVEEEFLHAFGKINVSTSKQQLQFLLDESKLRPLTTDEKHQLKQLLDEKHQ
jgi:DNA primase